MFNLFHTLKVIWLVVLPTQVTFNDDQNDFHFYNERDTKYRAVNWPIPTTDPSIHRGWGLETVRIKQYESRDHVCPVHILFSVPRPVPGIMGH